MKRLSDSPFVCLITRGEATSANYESEKIKILETIRESIFDGVRLIQVREKALSARLLFDLVSAAVGMAGKTDALIFVNERSDIAVAAGADGVHLPASSIPLQDVRRMLSGKLLIGVSTHTIEEAAGATAGGADYIFFGPVFETPGKGDPAGVELLKRVSTAVDPIPVVAIGGIDQDNFRQVLEAGAAGIAAIRALNERETRSQILRGLSAARVR